MKLAVGLGNPGREYEATRHNAGFWWIDALTRENRIALKTEARFHGSVGKAGHAGRDCWLLKPSTYMNGSGRAVQAIAHFYKIPASEILVIHDELDLPPGVAKLKKGGGVAGHNGLKDIAAHLGNEFWRLRIGIGHPGDRARVVSYVLAPPLQEEMRLIEDALQSSVQLWPMLMEGNTEGAMHRLHTRV